MLYFVSALRCKNSVVSSGIGGATEPVSVGYRLSYMSVHVLLNSLNELMKRDKMFSFGENVCLLHLLHIFKCTLD